MSDNKDPCHADHIVSTLAIAEELGVIALGALWWDAGYTNKTRDRVATEMTRQGRFLTQAWDAQTQELLVGIGDQKDRTDGSLLTFKDFAEAQRALAVGPPSGADGDNVTQTTVRPECSYASPTKPAADVAAHSAAALALGSMAVQNFTKNEALTKGWLEAAEGMLKWSVSLTGDLTNKSDTFGVVDVKDLTKFKGAEQDFGVRRVDKNLLIVLSNAELLGSCFCEMKTQQFFRARRCYACGFEF
jgi:hypothetical protein